MKFPNPASRYAIVGVFVAKAKDGVRVAVTGAGPVVFRQKDMEAALAKNFSANRSRAWRRKPPRSTPTSTPAPNTARIWSASWRNGRSRRRGKLQ